MVEMKEYKDKAFVAISCGSLCILASPEMKLFTLSVTVLLSIFIGWNYENMTGKKVDFFSGHYRIYALLGAIVSSISQYFGRTDGGALYVIWTILSIPVLYLVYNSIYTKYAVIILDLIKKNQRIVICSLFISICIVLIYIFGTDLFYGLLNGIFSMDSKVYIETNTFSFFDAPENDIRQPLYGLVAGIIYGPLNCLQWFDYKIYAMILGAVNPALIIVGLLLLSQGIDGDNKNNFVLFGIFLFPSMLFMLCIEQYVVLWFVLSMFVYEYMSDKKDYEITYIGAAGSLITSGFLILFCNKKRFPDMKNYLRYLMMFSCVIIVSGRSTIVLDLQHLRVLEKSYTYSGRYLEKLFQYLYFLRTVFFAPSANMQINNQGVYELQMDKVTSISIIGAIVLILSIISFAYNKKEKIILLSGVWSLLSMFILGFLGYGTKDNILPLYSLYFGWGYWILIYRFFNIIQISKIRNYVQYGLIATIGIYNLINVMGFVGLGLQYYPVTGFDLLCSM